MKARRQIISAVKTPHRSRRSVPTLDHEMALIGEGFRVVAGIDEAGRGAWAGPVVAAAVILPISCDISDRLRGVNDSKMLSSLQRDRLRDAIEQSALSFAHGSASQDEVDEYGIVNATRLAMQRAVTSLALPPDALIIDAVRLPALSLRQDVFYFADSISLSVSAASIIAKTARDAYMRELDSLLPGYGFASHKGYGTRLHQSALQRLGVSWAHRRSYGPIKRLCLPADVT